MKIEENTLFTKEEIVEIGSQHFLTDDYIKSVANTGKWCEHGSHLDMAEELFDDFGYVMDETLSSPANVETLLREWLPCRIRHIANEITYELSQSLELYREIIVKNDQTERVVGALPSAINTDSVGIYWSTKPSTYACGEVNSENLRTVKLKTLAVKSSINIIETIRSRIDYCNGDYEQEIQLFNGHELASVEIA